MTKHRDRRQKMLAETLDDNWSTGSAASMATRAAAYARRRRFVRRSVGTLVSGAAIVAVCFLALKPHAREEVTSPGNDANQTVAKNYITISDQQLIDSMAPLLILPNEAGGKKIVLVAR
jgi:hypothetical protein